MCLCYLVSARLTTDSTILAQLSHRIVGSVTTVAASMGSNVSPYSHKVLTRKLRADHLHFSSSCSDLCFRQCGWFHELEQRDPPELRNRVARR
jgi:hypothetical protein